jgi:Zn-dependent peptidase ImmA (M78 family)
MSNPTNKQIIESRILLRNPYAHMDELVYLNTLSSNAETQKRESEIYKIMGNPYASLNTMQPTAIPPRNTRVETPNLNVMENPYALISGNTKTISKHALMGNPYAGIDETDNSIRVNKRDIQPVSGIEQIARNIQINIWKNRNKLWPNSVPANPVDMLEPSVAFNSVGYECDVYETLDDYSNGQNFKIAGLIDQTNKKAYISNQFSLEIQRFTLAHELGHALMHEGSGLHRDRGLDGAPLQGKKDKIEVEADKFAAFFLMPRNLIISRFNHQFGADIFTLDEATMFALDPGNKMNLLSKKKNIRYISRLLAETEQYNGQDFISLSKQFRVSVEAMAIRLEELNLIKV